MISVFDVIMFILGAISHEFGHWITYRLVGFKADVRYRWYGVIEVGNNVNLYTTIGQKLYVTISGIIFGLPFFIHGVDMIIVYLVICSVDLFVIFIIILNLVLGRIKLNQIVGDVVQK